MPKPFLRRVTKNLFITGNLFISIFCLLGAYVKYFDPINWWFIGLLTLALPYLLILIIFFFFFWIFAKPIWALISLFTILLTWTSVTNIFPLNFHRSFSISKDTNSIRIMSWNVEQFSISQHKNHPDLKQKMIELINQLHPDIACFQEMVSGDKKNSINNLSQIEEALNFKDYNYSYNTKLDFDKDHHFGIIIFSRFPIISRQTISWPPHNYNSIFQYADVLFKKDTIRIFNIHLQSLRFTPNNIRYIVNPTVKDENDLSRSKNVIDKLKTGFLKRAVQSENIKDEMDKSPYPVVVCGDFNDIPDSYAYSVIGKNLQDAFVSKGSGFGRTFYRILPTLRIDNIFTGKVFKIEQFGRIPQKLSDHFPIIADISFNK